MPVSGNEKSPAIILISEKYKLTDWERSCALRFARRGYVALAIELHGSRDEKLKCIKSALEYIKSTGRTDSVGIIGWLDGGGCALEAIAKIDGFSSGVICYGQLPDDENISKINVPILGIFARGDESMKRFQDRLKSLGKQVRIKTFSSVKPGFMNPGSENYDEIIARNAWDKIDKFFSSTLCSQQ